jgi:Skp family chaperone for outer membrane proteins
MDDHKPARSADVRKLLATVSVCVLVSSAGLVQAQQAAPAGAAATTPAFSANAGRFGIAVVDISYIFKNYARFTAEIEKLKVEMEAADGQLKADRDRLVQMEQQRDTMKPGSADFKQLDEELARQKAEFSIKQGTIRRDFLEREAKVYYQTYNEVSAAVKYFAQQNNIGMVLRFNGDQIDPQQREDVMRAIMQPIVFQNNVDITPDVLQVLTRGVPAAQNAQRPTGAVQR